VDCPDFQERFRFLLASGDDVDSKDNEKDEDNEWMDGHASVCFFFLLVYPLAAVTIVLLWSPRP